VEVILTNIYSSASDVATGSPITQSIFLIARERREEKGTVLLLSGVK
jgi:hypothetical protein